MPSNLFTNTGIPVIVKIVCFTDL
nr:hypothetical protein [Atopobacter phocae]